MRNVKDSTARKDRNWDQKKPTQSASTTTEKTSTLLQTKDEEQEQKEKTVKHAVISFKISNQQ